MSEFAPIELGPPTDHTIAYGAISSLATYIVTQDPYFLFRTHELQRIYNDHNQIEANRYQGIRLLTHATAMLQKEMEGPLPVPPRFHQYTDAVWQYVAEAYEPRTAHQEVA